MIYSPSEDSYLLEECVKKFAKGKIVLDLGAGSGIQTEVAIKFGAKSVLSSDIDDDSIIFLKSKSPFRGLLDARSAPRTKVRGLSSTSTSKNYNVIKSDLFSKIKGKFNLIIFNPPYLPEDSLEDSESKLITTGGKKGDEIILRFLKNVKSYLLKKGIILLLLSSLTPKKRILTELKKQKLKKIIISKKKIFMEELQVWKIQ